MLWLPADREEVMKEAAPVKGFRPTAPNGAVPSRKVTLPVGVPPPPTADTVAVNVTASSGSAAPGLGTAVSATVVCATVVCGGALTVRDSPWDAEAPRLSVALIVKAKFAACVGVPDTVPAFASRVSPGGKELPVATAN